MVCFCRSFGDSPPTTTVTPQQLTAVLPPPPTTLLPPISIAVLLQPPTTVVPSPLTAVLPQPPTSLLPPPSTPILSQPLSNSEWFQADLLDKSNLSPASSYCGDFQQHLHTLRFVFDWLDHVLLFILEVYVWVVACIFSHLRIMHAKLLWFVLRILKLKCTLVPTPPAVNLIN